MRSTESIVQLVPDEYKRLIKNKLLELKDKLSDAYRNRKLYENLILKNEHKVLPNPILKGIKANIELDYYNKLSIYNMFTTIKLLSDTNNIANPNLIVGNDRVEANRIIVTYYEKFKTYVNLEYELNSKIIKYTKLDINIDSLRYMLRFFFKHASHYLLETGNWFSLPNSIHMKVKGRHRSRSDKYNNKRTKVDWGESIKTLIAISETVAPHLHTAYINKNIKKREFIDGMKEFTYHTTDRPKAPKWIVLDTNELDFWLISHVRYSRLQNIEHYAIVPSNYIAPTVVTKLGIERKQSAFMATVNNVTEIITTEFLGFRDKLAMLYKYDEDYCFNTYEVI